MEKETKKRPRRRTEEEIPKRLECIGPDDEDDDCGEAVLIGSLLYRALCANRSVNTLPATGSVPDTGSPTPESPAPEALPAGGTGCLPNSRRSTTKYTRENVLLLLKDMQRLLNESGETRYPRRSDFSGEEVVAIKAFWGPWPHALEAAGLKPSKENERRQRSLEKRIAAKRRRNLARNLKA